MTQASEFVEAQLLNQEELIAKHTKTISLNNVLEQLQALKKLTKSATRVAQINSLIMVIEDMFKIDMYKFHFKTATENIKSDIEALKRLIENEV
jgi:hypothetical protein